MSGKRDEWLDTAVRGIRFRPDRRAVRAELAAHLEDKTADLGRIFPDLTEEELRDRALAGMGSAAEIGKELARVHRPWLGWLWRISQAVLGLAVGAAVLLFFGACRTGFSSITGGSGSWYGETEPPVAAIYKGVKLDRQGALADSSPVRSGEYTFAAHQGELWVATGTERTSRVVYFRLEVRHPRPLEPLNTAVERRVWAEDDRGGTALSYTEYYALDVWEREDRAVVHCTVLDRGVFTDQYEVSLEIFDPEAERVDLRYTHMGADLTIPISLEVTGP